MELDRSRNNNRIISLSNNKMKYNVKVEVWEAGNPFNSAGKYYSGTVGADYNKEVAKLLEQINKKQNDKSNT